MRNGFFITVLLPTSGTCWIRAWSLPPWRWQGRGSGFFFNPNKLACGIVTCGGLCPGLNEVIRAVVLSLHYHYGVERVLGFRYGFQGLVKRHGHAPLRLIPESVNRIGDSGGTILASSRGPQDPVEMVDTLESMEVGILFAVGGDGTLKGAAKSSKKIARRGLPIAVIGIPKTIDNDISFIQTTFGFETAVAEARRAVYAAHAEASGAPNGIGLVKLMGRESGFIAAFSALVDSQVNFCLVPEVPFSLDRLLHCLERRLVARNHAVIVVAEGAGQELMAASGGHDASGNVKLDDIGLFLRDRDQGTLFQKGSGAQFEVH